MELQLEKAKPLLAIEEDFKAKMLELKTIELKKQQLLKSQEDEFNETLRNNESSLNTVVVEKKKEIVTLERKIELLENNYKQSQSVLSNLEKEINAYEAVLDVFDFGVYEPFYDFEKSETYRTELLKILENQKAGDAQLLKGHGNIASRDEITANIPAPGGTCSALQTQGCVVGDKTTRTDKCNINAATARGALPRAAARWPRRLRLHAECANLRRSPRTRTQPHLAAARQVVREPC